jgi:hypothetical protein
MSMARMPTSLTLSAAISSCCIPARRTRQRKQTGKKRNRQEARLQLQSPKIKSQIGKQQRDDGAVPVREEEEEMDAEPRAADRRGRCGMVVGEVVDSQSQATRRIYMLLAAFSKKDFASLSFPLFTTWGSDRAVGGGGKYGPLSAPSVVSTGCRLMDPGAGHVGVASRAPDSHPPRPRRVWLAALALPACATGPIRSRWSSLRRRRTHATKPRPWRSDPEGVAIRFRFTPIHAGKIQSNSL